MSDLRRESWKPRVFIVDDSRTVQAMLEQIFLTRLECDIVGFAQSAEEALPLIQSLRPDIVTIDIRMPGRDGLQLLRDLRDEAYARKVVIASEISEDAPLCAQASELGADATFDKRVFTGRPGFFCVRMREIIASLRGYTQRKVEPPEALQAATTHYPRDVREAERLRFLSEAGLANAERDTVFDGIARYMGGVAGFPICLITMIDSHVQWVKSAHGGEPQWSPRAEAFCNYTICDDAMMSVPNASTDPRFAHNPLVTGTPGVRAYFGYPITSPTGVRLGALCLVDLKPRKLPQLVEDNLRSMAEIVSLVIGQRWRAQAA